jgi:hypothetical protein
MVQSADEPETAEDLEFIQNESKLIMERLQVRVYSVEITYGINSIISKLMTFVENAETGQFLFLVILILSYFSCS